METEITNIEEYYKYSSSGIYKRNPELYKLIDEIKFDISFKEKMFLYANSISELPVCKICGNNVKFIDMKNGFRKYCSKKCMQMDSSVKDKRKNTNITKYGVDNPSKSKKIKEKVKITNNKKFGVDYAMQSNEIKEKSKKTNIIKYGVDNPSKLPEVRAKAENTNLEKFGVKHAMQNKSISESLKVFFTNKYGVDNPSKLPEIRAKAENTNLEKFGVKHAMQNDDIKKMSIEKVINKYGDYYVNTKEYKSILDKILLNKNKKVVDSDSLLLLSSSTREYNCLCIKCKKEFTIQRQLYRNRINNNMEVCLYCNPILSGKSLQERDIYNLIELNFSGEIVSKFRLENKEIDIYIPSLKLGFEFNGLYWHSELQKDKKYHYDKIKFFEKNGIKIIMIWEDDWLYKRDICESIILNSLGKSNKIWARKCEIEIIDNKTSSIFLKNNHLQGNINASVKIGLFYNKSLIAVMTFGKLRKSMGLNSSDGKYELLRFCNLKNTTVIGGASKLLEYFKHNFRPIEIISYSKNCIGNGGLYKKIGFDLVGETEIDYTWVINKVRYHRFQFRKDSLVKEGFDKNKTEVEIMYERGYYRVFGGGNKKWILEC